MNILDYKMMLGRPIKDVVHLSSLDLSEYSVETKYDGCRLAIYMAPDGRVQVMTRGGKTVRSPLLWDTFAHLAQFIKCPIVIDAELISRHGLIKDRRVATGALNTTLSKGKNLEARVKTDYLSLTVFDCVRFDENFRESYQGRRAYYTWLLSHKNVKLMPIYASKKYKPETVDDVLHILEEIVSVGGEGLVLKKGPYEFKRSSNLLKLKKMHKVVLKCVGSTPGDGKYTGMIGALQFNYKGTVIPVGSGLTDDHRSRDPREFIGKRALIKYESISHSSGTLVQPTIEVLYA